MKSIHVYGRQPGPDKLDRLFAGLLWLVVGLVIASAFGVLHGCASPARTADKGITASNELAQDLATVHTEIGAATPHCDPVGRGHLVSADSAVTSGQGKMPAINAGLAQVAPLQARVDKLNHQFFSPRQIGLAWVIGLSGVGLAVLLAVLFFATPLAAPIGTIAAGIFHGLTLGLGKLVHAVVGKIESNVAAARAKVATKPVGPGGVVEVKVPLVATIKGMATA